MDRIESLDMGTEEGRSKAEEHERAQAHQVRLGQQLYAKIKPTSKYFLQNDWAMAEAARWGGFPFMVRIDPAYGEYCVQGGPGGQYRLEDVNLFVVENGRELQIS